MIWGGADATNAETPVTPPLFPSMDANKNSLTSTSSVDAQHAQYPQNENCPQVKNNSIQIEGSARKHKYHFSNSKSFKFRDHNQNEKYSSLTALNNMFLQAHLNEPSEDLSLEHIYGDPVKPPKKRKKRKPSVTICTAHCKYESVRRVVTAFGLKEVDENDLWNIYWGDLSISIGKAKEMKRFQRINHFPGMGEICRKDLLAKNLNRMQKNFPDDYKFYPKTWCLPADFGDVWRYGKTKKNKVFIVKPESGSQGRGIYLTKNVAQLGKCEKLVCQLYISKPFLLDGYKFDIRVYTLVSSCDPLRIFIYNEGLARFATAKYADPTNMNCDNMYMHLTNYAVNKKNPSYIHHTESGSKRKLSKLNLALEAKGVDVAKLWKTIDASIVKTIISAWPILKHNYNAYFSSHDTVQACFEILGFDILLDQDANPFILEVNQSPSLYTDSLLDKEVKESLIADTLTILNIWQCDKRKVLEQDKQRVKDRLMKKIQKEITENSTPDENPKETQKSWQEQIEWENSHLGNYRCVYPSDGQYDKFFQQPSNSLYLTTISSRARVDCSKQQRTEFEAKQKLQTQNQLPVIQSVLKKEAKSGDQITRNKISLPKIKTNETSYGIYDPVPITEKEEHQRLSRLAHRDFIIEDKGISQKIYRMMKAMGTLTSQDEMKFLKSLQ